MALPKCPVCGAPRDESYRPFCSKRCADIDLAKWLGERYTIPTDEPGAPVPEAPRENFDE
jgi:endogenous inhibitor of DNA gyrase (YacG/DUF329 family)